MAKMIDLDVKDEIYIDNNLLKEANIKGKARLVLKKGKIMIFPVRKVKRRKNTNLVEEITASLRKGENPPITADWKKIEKQLEATKPYFRTVEDAMNWTRKRE